MFQKKDLFTRERLLLRFYSNVTDFNLFVQKDKGLRKHFNSGQDSIVPHYNLLLNFYNYLLMVQFCCTHSCTQLKNSLHNLEEQLDVNCSLPPECVLKYGLLSPCLYFIIILTFFTFYIIVDLTLKVKNHISSTYQGVCIYKYIYKYNVYAFSIPW